MKQTIVRRVRRVGSAIVVSLAISAIGLPLLAGAPAMATAEEEELALNLANLLRAARAVISAKQELINDPGLGTRG